MTEQCNHCRFWSVDKATQDPEDEDFAFGACRRSPPVLVDALVEAQIERPAWGSGEAPNDIMDATSLARATRHPTSFATDWCGKFTAKREA